MVQRSDPENVSECRGQESILRACLRVAASLRGHHVFGRVLKPVDIKIVKSSDSGVRLLGHNRTNFAFCHSSAVSNLASAPSSMKWGQ